MTTRVAIAALGIALSASFAVPVVAQSYTAPAGIPAVTAPGGVEGRAALPNLVDAQGSARGYTSRGYADDTLVTGSVRSPRRDPGRDAR